MGSCSFGYHYWYNIIGYSNSQESEIISIREWKYGTVLSGYMNHVPNSFEPTVDLVYGDDQKKQ